MKLASGIDSEKVSNTAKMYGFVNTQTSPEGVFAATKPAFKTGGVALKRNKKVVQQDENPWANLASAQNGAQTSADA